VFIGQSEVTEQLAGSTSRLLSRALLLSWGLFADDCLQWITERGHQLIVDGSHRALSFALRILFSSIAEKLGFHVDPVE
jgi:hypothetical protein